MGNWLKKYKAIFKISWQSSFVYRLSFFIWRIESIILFLTLYFFWYAVFRFTNKIAGYDEKLMLTYIIGTSVLRALILQSRSLEVSSDIASGYLSTYLLRPINYFYYWLSRDLADKALNTVFIFLELGLIFLILKPPFFIQTKPLFLLYFIIFSFLAILVYFYLSLLISLIAFWYPEHEGWPVRFVFMVLTQFMTGGLLPLDILPRPVFNLLKLLPTTYLRFFPLQIYLKRVSNQEILIGFFIVTLWLFLLRYSVLKLWHKGLKIYTAVGL